MKAALCLMCVFVAVAAKPSPFRSGGQYVLTYDNSLEDGRWDTSLEWVRRVGPPSGVSVKSGNAVGKPSLPYYMTADSSEEVMFMLGDTNPSVPQTRAQRVQDLTRMLNSGMLDRSDEFILRSVLNNPQAFGNRPYYVNNSGEIFFLPHAAGAGAGGASGPKPGSGVQSVKK